MSKVFKPRRGSADQVAAFIGEANEVILNTTTNTLHVMDGLTAGGFPLARADEVAAKDTEQDAAIAEAKSSADEKALSFEVDGLDLVITYGNGTTKRVKLPTGKGVGDLWCGHDPKSVPANVQLYSGQLLSRAAYEAHSGLVFSGKRTVVTESEWQSYASAHDGMCPYYSSGDGSTTYRMPCIKGVHPKFVAALAEAGQYVAAGLPNITGYLPWEAGTYTFEGAFYRNSRTTAADKIGGTVSGYNSIDFDASRSNPIYGNSDTVQPPALTFLLGEYVVGSVAVVGEADAESLLAGQTLLDAKVGALEGGVGRATAYVTETWSSGTSWYRKWSDGWIEQGAGWRGIGNRATITFSSPFTNLPTLLVTGEGNSSGGAECIGVVTKTSFVVNDINYGGTTKLGSWYACGY